MLLRLRWCIAEWLNLYHDVCWAKLVMWAIYPGQHDFWEILDMRGTAGFCARHGETPYCGKCKEELHGEE